MLDILLNETLSTYSNQKLIFINKASFDNNYLYFSRSDVPSQGAVGVSESSKDTVSIDES
jgi:hypothetical protein